MKQDFCVWAIGKHEDLPGGMTRRTGRAEARTGAWAPYGATTNPFGGEHGARGQQGNLGRGDQAVLSRTPNPRSVRKG